MIMAGNIMVIQEMMIGLKKTSIELRYDRLVLALEELERKRARKVKQILKIRKKLNTS